MLLHRRSALLDNKLLKLLLIVVMGTGFIITGCGKDKVVPPNQSPVGSITSSADSIGAGETITLTAAYTDPDNDEMTFAWVVAAGRLFYPESTVTDWNAPDRRGIYSFYLTISDGQLEILDSIRINVDTYTPPTGNDTSYYIGAETCADGGCHGDIAGRPALYTSWLESKHANAFESLLDGGNGENDNCLPCHTTGWDAGLANGGYDEFHFPYLEGVQCEECHGPGSEHKVTIQTIDSLQSCVNAGPCHPTEADSIYKWSNRDSLDWNGGVYDHTDSFDSVMVMTISAAQCSDCHETKHYNYSAQWDSSAHSTSANAAGANPCGDACHTANGYLDWLFTDSHGQHYPFDPPRTSIACLVCHDPHFPQHPGELREPQGILCSRCHNEKQLEVDDFSEPVHVHGAMFAGVGGHEYDSTYTNSAHTALLNNQACGSCHISKVSSNDDGLAQHTPHKFQPSLDNCTGCHIGATNFNVNGVQDSMTVLLDTLEGLLASEPSGTDSTYAAFNWKFVNNDGSKGVHNSKYAFKLLNDAINSLILSR